MGEGGGGFGFDTHGYVWGVQDPELAARLAAEASEAAEAERKEREEFLASPAGKLYNQILGQKTTSKWSGEGFGGPEANAKVMAQMLAGAGITDIRDFGQIKKTTYSQTPVQAEIGYTTNGMGETAEVTSAPTGRYYTQDPETGARTFVDASQVKTGERTEGSYGADQGVSSVQYHYIDVPSETTVFGNKKTGQEVDPNYNRAGGNVFGGTYTGHGRTNFAVQFAPDGTPYFYTEFGGDTSNMKNIMPIVGIGLALFAPGIGGAIGSALTGTAATTVASQVIGGAIVSGTMAELSGGNFMDAAITAGITAGLTPVIANTIGSSISSAMADSIFREVVVNATASAAASAVAAAVTGKDVGESALVGAVTGAAAPIGRLAGGTIAEAMNGAALTETVANAVAGATSSAISASILNKDVSDAILSGFVSGAAGSIGRELGTSAEYGTDPLSEQNQMLLKQEKGMGTSGTAGANLGTAVGKIALGGDPLLNILDAITKTNMESALAKGTPVNVQNQTSQNEAVTTDSSTQNVSQAGEGAQTVAGGTAVDDIAPDLKNIENIISGPSANVAQAGDTNADLSVIDSILSDKPETEISTTTVTAPDGSQLVYDQDNNLVDIVESPDTSVVAPEPLVPDASNPNLEPGKTPQERAAEEWQRYLGSLGSKPADLDLPNSTIDAGEYWDEYNQNLKRIMDAGGYTSQWQNVNGDKVFVSDDGTAIGINENGGTYALTDTEVERMVNNGLLNTADSGYVDATGGTGDKPGGYDPCGPGFHWDEARQMCIADTDEPPESQECPPGHIFNLETQTCVPAPIAQEDVSVKPSIKTVNPDVDRPQTSGPSSRNPFAGDPRADNISRAIQDEPLRKLGLPIYEKMDKFEGPLDDFLKMVAGGSYVNRPTQQPQQPQQANNMNMPNQPDLLDQKPSYFNYGRDTNIDQNLFGGQNSLNNDQRLFGGQNSLNYDQQLFGGQNSMDYDRQLFSNPNPFKDGGLAVPLMAEGGTTRYGRYAGGGLNVVEHSGKQRLDFRKGAAVTGEGDGQSDDIPAMLADGEFVFPADVVAALGNGSTKAGSDKLYDMMHAIRAHHRSAKPEDLPPPAKKSPLDYLEKPARKARG